MASLSLQLRPFRHLQGILPGVLLCCLAHQAHGGAPPPGVLLCRSAHQALKGAPWVGSDSVVEWVRFLTGQPLCCSATDAGLCGERLWGCFHPLCMTQQYRLASMAAQLSSTGISHHNLLLHIPSICLSAVNSSPLPGTAPQPLNYSSQPLLLPGDLHPCLDTAGARTV